MQKDKKTTQIALVLATLSLGASCLFAQPAQAIISDQSIVGRLQEQHDVLLIKERRLLQDYDDLQRQIREFQKDNDRRMMDLLCRQADAKYEDLQSIRYNLRQIETLLL